MTARRIIVISAGPSQFSLLFMCIYFLAAKEAQKGSKILLRFSFHPRNPSMTLTWAAKKTFRSLVLSIPELCKSSLRHCSLLTNCFKLSDVKLDVCPTQKCTRSFEFPIQMSHKKTIFSRQKSLEDTIQSYCWPIKDIFYGPEGSLALRLSLKRYLRKVIFFLHCGQNI